MKCPSSVLQSDRAAVVVESIRRIHLLSYLINAQAVTDQLMATSRLFGTNLPAIRKDAYACQTGYSAYASLWENAEDGLCSESAPLPSRSIRSIRPSAVI